MLGSLNVARFSPPRAENHLVWGKTATLDKNMSLFELLEELDGLADHLFSSSGEDRAAQSMRTPIVSRMFAYRC